MQALDQKWVYIVMLTRVIKIDVGKIDFLLTQIYTTNCTALMYELIPAQLGWLFLTFAGLEFDWIHLSLSGLHELLPTVVLI